MSIHDHQYEIVEFSWVLRHHERPVWVGYNAGKGERRVGAAQPPSTRTRVQIARLRSATK